MTCVLGDWSGVRCWSGLDEINHLAVHTTLYQSACVFLFLIMRIVKVIFGWKWNMSGWLGNPFLKLEACGWNVKVWSHMIHRLTPADACWWVRPGCSGSSLSSLFSSSYPSKKPSLLDSCPYASALQCQVLLVRKDLWDFGHPGKRYGRHQHWRNPEVLNVLLVRQADVPLHVIRQETDCSRLQDWTLSQVGQDALTHESQSDRQSS